MGRRLEGQVYVRMCPYLCGMLVAHLYHTKLRNGEKAVAAPSRPHAVERMLSTEAGAVSDTVALLPHRTEAGDDVVMPEPASADPQLSAGSTVVAWTGAAAARTDMGELMPVAGFVTGYKESVDVVQLQRTATAAAVLTVVPAAASCNDDGTAAASSSMVPAVDVEMAVPLARDVNEVADTEYAAAHSGEATPAPRPCWVQLLWFAGIAVSLALMMLDVGFGGGYNWADVDPTWYLLYLVFHRSMFGAGVAFLIFCALAVRRRDGTAIYAVVCAYRWLSSCRPLFVVAQLSYSMYLVHLILMYAHMMVQPLLQFSWWRFLEHCVENFAASALLALLLFVFVEKPLMNLRVGG